MPHDCGDINTFICELHSAIFVPVVNTNPNHESREKILCGMPNVDLKSEQWFKTCMWWAIRQKSLKS